MKKTFQGSDSWSIYSVVGSRTSWRSIGVFIRMTNWWERCDWLADMSGLPVIGTGIGWVVTDVQATSTYHLTPVT